MTQQPFRARGAVDLGALAARRAAEQAAATGPAPAAVLDVGEAGLQRDVLEASFALPVVVAFWSARAGGPGTEVLEAAVTARAGRLLLRRVDVDAEPRVAQAFGITAVPTVVAVLKGQPVGLYEGEPPADQVAAVLDQVVTAAAASGVAAAPGGPPTDAPGAPEGPGAAPGAAEPPSDPRFDAAFDAVDAGDWDAAEAAYRQVLATTPADPVAQAGLAYVGLLRRTDGVDLTAAVAAAKPGDVGTGLAAADAEILAGDAAAAFARLVALVRDTSGEERDAVRARLLELFEVVGADHPDVAPARVALANALF